MLDFYLLNDQASVPKNPNGLIYVGGIEFTDFQYLFNISIIENGTGYFQDFRWTNNQVLEKYNALSNIIVNNQKNNKLKSEVLLLNILEKAKESGNGLFTFCD